MENLDFNVKVHGTLNLFGIEIWITDTLIFTWIIGAFLILLAIYVNISIRKFNKVPKGFQNFIELVVETFANFTEDTVDKRYSFLGFWFFGVFAFLLLSNLSGLIGMRAPTADISTTFALAAGTFLMIHGFGIFFSGKDYFKGYIEPFIFFLPINLIGELATPISLAFRLFGNVLSGLIIMSMLYAALPIFFVFVVPPVLHVYFDLFSGCLQAFVFVILSLTFIRQKLPE